MTDSVTARLVDARTILTRAALDLEDGECKSRIMLACSACGDALEQRSADTVERTRRNLEVLADALAAPSVRNEQEAA